MTKSKADIVAAAEAVKTPKLVDVVVLTYSRHGATVVSRGLRGRRVKPGVTRLVVEQGAGRPKVLTVAVQFGEPMVSEKVLGLVRTCDTHGYFCPLSDDDGSSCALVDNPVMVGRWYAWVVTVDRRTIEVHTAAAPKVRTVAGARRARGVRVHRHANVMVMVTGVRG